MKLQDQLTELRRNILRDYSTQVYGTPDQQWSDETLVSYIGDAEKKFCRETFILRDADTPVVTQVRLQTGVSRYLLHPSIHAVVSARFDADTFDLKRVGRTLIMELAPPDTLFFDPSNFAPLSPGRPTAFSTDELLTFQSKARVALVAYPAPSSAENGKLVYLRAARAPLRGYTMSDGDLATESEISDDYVYDVLEWAAYRAMRNHDADASDPVDASAHKTAFEDAVEKCKADLRARLISNTQFIFGSNGFSWVR